VGIIVRNTVGDVVGEVVVVTPKTLREWPLPDPGAGKEDRGALLVLGGSTRTPGAVRLSGEAGLGVGAGKLVLATAASATDALGVLVPEAMTCPLPVTAAGDLAVDEVLDVVQDELEGAGCVLLGPGLRDPDHAVALMERLVPRLDGAVVLDAVASAFLAEHPEGLPRAVTRRVLTVNPDELAHTAGCPVERVEDEPEVVAGEVARDCAAVVLCGGSTKHVVAPDGRVWSVEGGGPGLGVSGSGDVQAGLVAGLLARGADAEQAAVWAAYVHARSGERLAATSAAVGYLARDLPGQAPHVLAELRDH
jgi:ADP-dependent NAD(P)H-hydrate dehydratase